MRDTHGPEAIAFLGGARGTNEDAYTWCRLMKGVIGTDNTDAQLADGLPADVVLGLPRAVIGDLDRAKAIVVIAGDLREELPILHLRIRRAAVDLGVPLVEVSARTTGLSRDATVLRAVPGEQARAVEPLVSLLRGDERRATAAGRDGDMLASFAAALEGRDGPVVVVVGRPSVAETADATVQAAARLVQVPGTRFLSALRRGNVHGALDLGLAPGFLPGRVTLDAGRNHVGATWGTVPERRGLDAAGILRAAADGEVRALVLLGCDPLGDFPDRRLAERAIANVEFLLVVGAFAEDAAERANVVLAASVWSEHRGSGSNLEGRVQRLAAKITAEGTTMASWQIACELAARFGSDFGLETVEDVQNEIAAVAPAFAGVDARLIRQARDGVVIPISDHPDELAFGPTQGASGRSWEPIRPTIADDGTDAFTEEEARARRTHRPPMPLHAWTAESARPGPAVPVNAYALRLVAGRTLYGDDRHTIHSPSVARLIEPARLLVNPADRDRVVTSEGAVVRVSTPTASLDLPVHADRATPRGVAFLAVNSTAPGARDLIDIDAPVTELRMETTS